MNPSAINDKQTFPLDLKHFHKLAKYNPLRLANLLQTHGEKAMEKLYQEIKAAGVTVSYEDPAYPGCLIQERPDGRRFIVEPANDPHYQAKIIREIPRR